MDQEKKQELLDLNLHVSQWTWEVMMEMFLY